MSARIAVIPGDGVGLEVVPEAVQVLEHVNPELQFDYFDWGSQRYHELGAMRPEDGLDQLAGHDAVLLGSIGWPTVPDHISLWEGLMPLRKAFDLYVNLRPVNLLPGPRGPLADRGPADVDMLFIRENTEGEYSGAGGSVHGAPGGSIQAIGDHEIAVEVPVFTSWAIERCARYAFEQANARSGKLILSLIHI